MHLRNVVSLMLLSTTVLAAGEAGNGGDVVVCRSGGQVTSAKVLDFHEAEVLRPTLVHSLGDSTLTPIDKVALALTRLEAVDQERATRYTNKARTFFTNVRFVKGVVLQDINDSGYVPIPAHCQVEQIAIQKPPAFPEDRLYTINRDLWDLLDNDHRAGLILHEIVYGELIALGHRNSVKARYFTSLVSAAVMETISQTEYETRRNTVFGGNGPLPGNLEFTAPSFDFSMDAGGCHSVDLMGLLKAKGTGALKWNILGMPSWIRLDSAASSLEFCPDRPQVGQHNLRLAVQDQDMGALAILNVTVRAQNVPPIWLQDPIRLQAKANTLFAQSLAQYAQDPDGDRLTFQKISGPSWLVIGPDGVIQGTPSAADMGASQFQVRATDGIGLSSTVTVIIEVN